MGFSLKKICSIFFKEKTKQTCETKWQSPLVPKKKLERYHGIDKITKFVFIFPYSFEFRKDIKHLLTSFIQCTIWAIVQHQMVLGMFQLMFCEINKPKIK